MKTGEIILGISGILTAGGAIYAIAIKVIDGILKYRSEQIERLRTELERSRKLADELMEILKSKP